MQNVDVWQLVARSIAEVNEELGRDLVEESDYAFAAMVLGPMDQADRDELDRLVHAEACAAKGRGAADE